MDTFIANEKHEICYGIVLPNFLFWQISSPWTCAVTNYIILNYGNGYKRFKCSICPVTFRRKADFKRHFEIMHEGKKPYQCSICHTKFIYRKKMEKHILLSHEERKSFQCPLCQIKFGQDINLKEHFQIVHVEKKYECCYCLAILPSKNGFVFTKICLS